MRLGWGAPTMPGMSSDEPRPFQIRSLGLSVYLPTFLFAVGQGALIPILPLYATDLGASVAIASLIVALRNYGTMFFDVPAGLMVSRFGERGAMVIGTVALCIVAVGAAQTRSLAVIAVLVFIMGGAWSIWTLARLAYVSEVAPLEQRGRAMSLLGGTNRIGNFVGPFIGGVAAVAWGLESAFYIQAVLAVAASVTMFLLMSGGEGKAEVHDTSVYRRISGVLQENTRIFATAGTAMMAVQALRAARQVLIPLWGARIGLDPAEIGAIVGLSFAIDMTLFYPVGIVMDRWGRKWAAVPSLVIMAVGTMLIPVTDSLTGLLLVAMIGGFGNGLGAGLVMTLGADFSPPTARGEFLGVWRLISDVGSAGGPTLISALAATLTLGAASVATGGLGLAGAAIMYCMVAEPLQKRPRPG